MKFDFEDRSRCFSCEGTHFCIITTVRSPRIPEVKQKIGICKSCGFIMITPLLTNASYKNLNEIWYSRKYRLVDSTNPQHDKSKRWVSMVDRSKGLRPNFSSLLDVGAGQGEGIKYLKFRGLLGKAIAIEQSKICCDHISKNLNVNCINTDLSENWSKELGQEKFTFIICRHVLEHLKNPKALLNKIRTHLSPRGMVYIVVPNIFGVKRGFPMRTDFFRPVHLSYFDSTSLVAMADECGLEVLKCGPVNEGELWCFFRCKERNVKSEFILSERLSVDERLQFLNTRIKQSRFRDLSRIMVLSIRRLMSIR